MAVTFLWRGKPATRNVMVLWIPYAGVVPDEYLMARLGETDVWQLRDIRTIVAVPKPETLT